MTAFQDALETYSLSGIPTKGPKFTCFNHRQGEGFTKEKLDRSLANPKGMEIFSSFYCHVLSALKSNDSPLFISITSRNEIHGKKAFIFRYEAGWDLYDNCTKVVKTSKKCGGMTHNGPSGIQSRISTYKATLLKWRKWRKNQENEEHKWHWRQLGNFKVQELVNF